MATPCSHLATLQLVLLFSYTLTPEKKLWILKHWITLSMTTLKHLKSSPSDHLQCNYVNDYRGVPGYIGALWFNIYEHLSLCILFISSFYGNLFIYFIPNIPANLRFLLEVLYTIYFSFVWVEARWWYFGWNSGPKRVVINDSINKFVIIN